MKWQSLIILGLEMFLPKINSKRTQTLANLRDTLLPKLLSGEVRANYE
jgi:hypothetical protein